MWNLLLQHKLWQNLYIIIYLQNQHGLWTIACLVSLHLLSIALYCKVGSNLPTHLGQILTGALLKKLAGFFWVKCSLVLNRFAIEWRLVTNRPLCLAGQQNCKNAPFGSLLDAFPCNWPIVSIYHEGHYIKIDVFWTIDFMLHSISCGFEHEQ